MAQTITGSRTALQTMYRKEYIAGFERWGSELRRCLTTEYMTQGNSIVFLVADSGNATAVGRGSDGLYPARANNNNQITLTLKDKTDLPRMNDFDIFSSQGAQRDIMYQTSVGVINRAVDDEIITALDTTVIGVSTDYNTDAYGQFMAALAILGQNNAGVQKDGDITAVITTAFWMNMLKAKEFTSIDYVETKILVSGVPQPVTTKRYMGVNIIVHNGLPGAGTSTEKNFMFNRRAVGSAVDKENFNPLFGFNDEQNYSWCRNTVYSAAALLQGSGVVEMRHDASAYTAVTVS